MPNRKALLPLLLLPALVPASGSPPDTNWTKSPISAMELAQKSDRKLHSLKTTSMDYWYQFGLDTGKAMFSGFCAVKSQDQYRIEFPLVGTTEKYGIRRRTIVQNGNRVSVLTENLLGKPFTRQTSNAPLVHKLPSNFVDEWYRGNVQYLLSAIGSAENPLEALVSSASANPEYRVRAETRVIPFKNISLREYRITVDRNPTVAKKKGELFYEVVIGDKYFFPLAMNNLKRLGNAKKGKTFYTRMFGTRWNQSPNQKWNPQSFSDKVLLIERETPK